MTSLSHLSFVCSSLGVSSLAWVAFYVFFGLLMLMGIHSQRFCWISEAGEERWSTIYVLGESGV